MPDFKPLLTNHEQAILHDALHYMKMAELRASCLVLGLPKLGNKRFLIDLIMHFVQTRKVLVKLPIPAISRANNHAFQTLAPNSLMLYGQYKNDLKNRNFFKTIIGEYFHYTAFGIDWLNTRWQAGQPPSYQEFADYWKQEYTQRQLLQAPLKAEWAYLNFLQKLQKEQPNLSQSTLLAAWKAKQTEQASLAKNLLTKMPINI